MKKKIKRKNHHSRERKKNHIVIIADFEDERKEKTFKTELRKMARNMNHLSQNEFSFEMYSSVVETEK